MRAFVVKAGTQVNVIPVGKEWYGNNFQEHTTVHENMFFLEDMVVDPTGILTGACGPQDAVTIGGHYAKRGNYGFKKDSWVMLVHANDVQVG